MVKISRKKKVVATVSSIAIAVSLAVGGTLLNNKPVVTTPTDDAVVSPIVSVTPQPTIIPSKAPVPTKTPIPTKSPKPPAIPTVAPKVLEVTEVTPAPVDTFELFGISGEITVDGTYAVKKVDKNKSEFSIVVPAKLSADMYELYLNRQFVDKQLLPNGKIVAPPLLFTVPELLEVRIIKLQKVIGIGRFKDGKFTISVKDGVISE